MTDQPQILFAKEHLDPSGSIVLSARLLGQIAVERLETAPSIIVSFADMRGLPSSYFNELLRMIGKALKTTNFSGRIEFKFDSSLQNQVFQRSLTAMCQSAA